MLVGGLDACKAGWVGISLDDGRFIDASLYAHVEEALAEWNDATSIVIDMPIGLPGDGDVGFPRAADREASAFLHSYGARSSVFTTPPASVLQSADFASALTLMRSSHGIGLSRQAFGLAVKLLQVRDAARSDERLVEGHPEVTFRMMTTWSDMGHASRKRSWNGANERRSALAELGVVMPDRLEGAGDAAVDDVLDAAAMAWTAWTVATDRFATFPAEPAERDDTGRRVAIHFPTAV